MIDKINQVDQDIPATKHLHAVSNKFPVACDLFTLLHWVILPALEIAPDSSRRVVHERWELLEPCTSLTWGLGMDIVIRIIVI